MSALEFTSSALARPAPLHSLKLSLTFWAILSAWPALVGDSAREARCTQEEKPTMDDTFPDVGSFTGEIPITGNHVNELTELLAHPRPDAAA
jgi:hypothetical protein